MMSAKSEIAMPRLRGRCLEQAEILPDALAGFSAAEPRMV